MRGARNLLRDEGQRLRGGGPLLARCGERRDGKMNLA